MKVLIDTHIAIWAIEDNPKLSAKAKEILMDSNNEIFFSVASAWEVTIKHQNHPEVFPEDGQSFASGCEDNGYIALPVMLKHVYAVSTLKRSENAPRHKDPFDRIILAQAKSENFMFLTHDSLIADYNEPFVITV